MSSEIRASSSARAPSAVSAAPNEAIASTASKPGRSGVQALERVLGDRADVHAAAEEVPARLREAQRERVRVAFGHELRVDLRGAERLALEPRARRRKMRKVSRPSGGFERRGGTQRAFERRQRRGVFRRDVAARS